MKNFEETNISNSVLKYLEMFISRYPQNFSFILDSDCQVNSSESNVNHCMTDLYIFEDDCALKNLNTISVL